MTPTSPPTKVPRLPEYSCVLREIKPGEFTVVSFRRIAGLRKDAKPLRVKEVLSRKLHHPTMSQYIDKLHGLTKPEQCLVHRVLYYIHAQPVISDFEYDRLERDAINELAETSDNPDHALLKPGSDRASSYTQATLHLASCLLS